MKSQDVRELQKRALRALARIRKKAASLPPEVKTPEAIEAEIRAVRAQRKRSEAK
jgi:hypothetical protein